jgi:hypothetical protein
LTIAKVGKNEKKLLDNPSEAKDYLNFMCSSKRGFAKNFAKLANAGTDSNTKIYGKSFRFLQICKNFVKFLQKFCNCTNLYISIFAKICKKFAKFSRFA